jgi:ribosome-binding factor A
MNRKRFSKRSMQPLCGEIHSDDGIDPHEFFRSARQKSNQNRKVLQLCRQVAETLNLVFSNEFGEEIGDVRVVAVAPAPDASQLLVVVGPAVAGSVVDPVTVVSSLTAAAGRLRSEVAAAITRRRAPKLLFQYIDGEASPEVTS